MVNFCFDIIVEVKQKGVILGLEFHECHRQDMLLWALLNLLLLFQKEKLTIWTQLNLKAIKFQVLINLHSIKTHPAYIKTETVKEIKHVWVTYTAGCSLTGLQNGWNNEVQFYCEVSVPPCSTVGLPREQNAQGLCSHIPSVLPSMCKPCSSQHPHGPNACLALDAGVMGCTRCRMRPTDLFPSEFAWQSKAFSPVSAEATVSKGAVNQRESKVKQCSGEDLPIPVKSKCEAKTKAAGTALQRNGP